MILTLLLATVNIVVGVMCYVNGMDAYRRKMHGWFCLFVALVAFNGAAVVYHIASLF